MGGFGGGLARVSNDKFGEKGKETESKVIYRKGVG